jgi:anti-sigma factor RsiW
MTRQRLCSLDKLVAMDEDEIDQDRLIAYLLGKLSEQEESSLEALYFSDEAAHEELLAAEDELIDRYVAGELQGTDRERFERLFLTDPTRRERVEIARELRKKWNEFHRK